MVVAVEREHRAQREEFLRPGGLVFAQMCLGVPRGPLESYDGDVAALLRLVSCTQGGPRLVVLLAAFPGDISPAWPTVPRLELYQISDIEIPNVNLVQSASRPREAHYIIETAEVHLGCADKRDQPSGQEASSQLCWRQAGRAATPPAAARSLHAEISGPQQLLPGTRPTQRVAPEGCVPLCGPKSPPGMCWRSEVCGPGSALFPVQPSP